MNQVTREAGQLALRGLGGMVLFGAVCWMIAGVDIPPDGIKGLAFRAIFNQAAYNFIYLLLPMMGFIFSALAFLIGALGFFLDLLGGITAAIRRKS
jgi:hypothetical protein